jgi:hypothetical protein
MPSVATLVATPMDNTVRIDLDATEDTLLLAAVGRWMLILSSS